MKHLFTGASNTWSSLPAFFFSEHRDASCFRRWLRCQVLWPRTAITLDGTPCGGLFWSDLS
ncbi:hypothetical protein LEMLEM_LOCUS20880, partial [Lemmus lemmus]